MLVVLLAPFLALVGFGVLVPLGRAVDHSLLQSGAFAEPYRVVWQDGVFWATLVRTIVVAGLVSLVSLAIAYPTAEFIHQARPGLRPLLLTLIIIPLWTSTIARVYGWVGIFVRDGAIDRLAGVVDAGPLRLLYTKTSVFVGMVHASLPLILLASYAAVRSYDERLTLASLSLGAGRWRTHLRVKMPVLAAPLAAGTVGVFVLALGFFETPGLLGGPDSQLISNLIYQQISQRFDIGRAQAMSIVFLIATLITLGAMALTGRLVARLTGSRA